MSRLLLSLTLVELSLVLSQMDFKYGSSLPEGKSVPFKQDPATMPTLYWDHEGSGRYVRVYQIQWHPLPKKLVSYHQNYKFCDKPAKEWKEIAMQWAIVRMDERARLWRCGDRRICYDELGLRVAKLHSSTERDYWKKWSRSLCHEVVRTYNEVQMTPHELNRLCVREEILVKQAISDVEASWHR